MSIVVKRDGTVTWRGKPVGTITKRFRGSVPLWEWQPHPECFRGALTSDLLRTITHRLQRDFVEAERAK